MGILPLTLFVASQTNITNSEVSIDGGGTTSRNFVFDKITKLKNFVFLLVDCGPAVETLPPLVIL